MHDHDDPFDAPPRISFSLREVLHLAASVVVLTLAFTFILGARKGELFGMPTFDLDVLIELLPYAAIAVIPAFILHELAHKIVAQRKDMWAEFRASPIGLLGGFLVTALTGFLFASPGAVEIVGDANRRDAGVISIVGPAVNLVLAALAILFEPLLRGYNAGTMNLADLLLLLNVVLAAFNMLPIGPLDGRKVLRWSALAFVGVWLTIIGLAMVGFRVSLPF